MGMVVVGSEAQEELQNIGEDGGPSWCWDPCGASYHIMEMQDDGCLDPSGITHHIMD